ncbi:hypothetical protein V3O24_04500 [Methylobacter sp. Wu8]|uniref:hypothetical protein n=1 Tax=Methylobacter sp. Wu8 TaxID=3118457 RepID=UPI002F3023DC
MSDYDKRIIPPFVNVGKHERMLNLSAMTENQRRTIWIGIKTANPALAKLLKTDGNIAELKQQLNATVQLTVADCNRYMEAGLKAIEEKNNDY